MYIYLHLIFLFFEPANIQRFIHPVFVGHILNVIFTSNFINISINKKLINTVSDYKFIKYMLISYKIKDIDVKHYKHF